MQETFTADELADALVAFLKSANGDPVDARDFADLTFATGAPGVYRIEIGNATGISAEVGAAGGSLRVWVASDTQPHTLETRAVWAPRVVAEVAARYAAPGLEVAR